ncbi:TPA: hypothetical protein ACH3X3_007617 [Trebouxia sp. C0006]
MTGTRTRSTAATNASKVSVPRKVGQNLQTKKRKHSDLDQVTSDSEVELRSPTSKFVEEDKKIRTGGSDGYSGPYPQHSRPTPEECQASQVARDGLAALHGDPKRAALGEEKFELAEGQAAADKQASNKESWQKTVLDSLVCTILSQNTTDVNSARAFAKLKEKFPEWEMVRTADSADVEESIKSGGLAAIKTERIKVILNTLKSERGECSLEHLQQRTDEEIKAELERFKGVGKKTIACVLMFCLDRHEFPVDTHVWRITKAMGWVPSKATRDEAYSHLNARIPDHLKYDLHVLLVNHGKRCPRCAKNGKPRKASDGDCPLFGTKTVKEILKDEPNQDSGSEATVKPDPASDSDVVVKEDPDGDSEMKVKADLIKDPGSKKRQKGSKGSTVGNEASGGNDNVNRKLLENHQQSSLTQTSSWNPVRHDPGCSTPLVTL